MNPFFAPPMDPNQQDPEASGVGASLMRRLNDTPMGRLLTRYGFKPWEVDPTTQEVARQAATDIQMLLDMLLVLDPDRASVKELVARHSLRGQAATVALEKSHSDEEVNEETLLKMGYKNVGEFFCKRRSHRIRTHRKVEVHVKLMGHGWYDVACHEGNCPNFSKSLKGTTQLMEWEEFAFGPEPARPRRRCLEDNPKLSDR